VTRSAAVAAFSILTACHSPSARHAAPTTIESCDYQVALSADGRARVHASCKADGPIAFRLAAAALARHVHASIPPKSGRFAAVGRALDYEVDLKQLAAGGHDFDRAAQVGASFVGTMSSVLLVPEPLTTEIPVTVHVEAAPPVVVSVGLRRGPAADTYQLMAHEIVVATYFAFGKLEKKTLDLGGAKLELTRLDGALDQSFDDIGRWVEKSATAVRDFYGAFPVARASVTIIPIPSRDAVVFGKVLPESEPGVALLLGEHAPRQALYSDWILVHELFHLGFPSFFREGKWLDEGLATYYEPIIRVRAGLYSELELWDELESQMPEGLPAFRDGLEQAANFRGIYWGGAIACLLADVEARRRSPSRGLEVGLRALREAGGTASEVWSLEDAIGVIDNALGAPTLAPIAESHARRGSAFDLAGLFSELGVNRDPSGAVQLSDSAPLSAVRRAIVRMP
jgi:hypothetical protein